MYTQTLYELSQEAERLLQLSRQQLQLLEKIPLSVPGDDAPQLALPWSQPNIAERHAMLNNELRKNFPAGNGAGDCRYHESREINHH